MESLFGIVNLSLVIAAVLLFLLLWLGYTRAARISGFGPHVVKKIETFEYTGDDEEAGQPQKRSITTETQSARTVWEWLTVLTISAVIAGAALWFTTHQAAQQQAIQGQQAKAQQDLQVQQANDDALQVYLDQMSALLIKEDLRTSPEDSEARMLARARTLTILSRLDPGRRSRVLQFLLEAELVQATDIRGAVINLKGANLRGVVLPADTDLSYADLSSADLSGADLSATNLSNAYLVDADLSKADLSGTTLSRAGLDLADLRGANLSNTDLTFAVLNDADLTDATVTGADLWRADLNDAEGVTTDTLETHAGVVAYTIMPGGKNYQPPASLSVADIIKEYPKGRLPSGVFGEPLRVAEYETEEFATGFHFDLGEGWKGGLPEATDQLNLCGEEYCQKQLNFASPLYVYSSSNPSAREKTLPPQNADEWMAWLQKHPNLHTSNSGSVNIAGALGRRIEVTSASTQSVPLFPIIDSTYYALPGWKERFLIVDVAEETVIIGVSAPADQFDEWLPTAKKTLDTVVWQGV
jgi:uncharacterized protein YjbI with pentapeptide repeats